MNCLFNACVILIISAEDNNEVQVLPQLAVTDKSNSDGNNVEITYDGDTYSNGQVIRQTLNYREAMQIKADQIDLSGTRVNSPGMRKLAVFVATQRDCLLPLYLENNKTCGGRSRNLMVQQLPARGFLGKNHIIAPINNDVQSSYIKVVFYDYDNSKSSQPQSQLLEDLGISENIGTQFLFSRNCVSFVFTSLQTVHLVAKYRVVIAQYLYSLDSNQNFPPTMLILNSVESWKSTGGGILPYKSNSIFTVLTAQCECISE